MSVTLAVALVLLATGTVLAFLISRAFSVMRDFRQLQKEFLSALQAAGIPMEATPAGYHGGYGGRVFEIRQTSSTSADKGLMELSLHLKPRLSQAYGDRLNSMDQRLIQSPYIRVTRHAPLREKLARFLSGIKPVTSVSLSFDQRYSASSIAPQAAREALCRPGVEENIELLFSMGFRSVEIDMTRMLARMETGGLEKFTPETVGAALKALAELEPKLNDVY